MVVMAVELEAMNGRDQVADSASTSA
jgi:hypothetical protein